MIGFEFSFKGNKIYAALGNGVVSVIATQLSKGNKNSIEVDLKGLDNSDPHEDKLIDWFHAFLNKGDEFTVRIVDVPMNSQQKDIRCTKRESKIASK